MPIGIFRPVRFEKINAMREFLWDNRSNRWYLIAAWSIILMDWFVFKHFYPSPNLVFDSYHYIRAAALKANVNAWPIGYSKFIQLFSLFSHSIDVFLFVQYFLLMLSFVAFFFSIRWFFKPGPAISVLIFVFLFVNPVFVFCCNFVLSDPLFISLSIFWLLQLFWILYRPRTWMIWSQALLLGLAFSVRYNALYYPLIGAMAFFLSRQRTLFKVAGIAISLVVVGGFILFTQKESERVYGVRQFSPFAGWKLANDAMYVYAHTYDAIPDKVPAEFERLDSLSRKYFQQPGVRVDFLYDDPSYGSWFMFFKPSPLVAYLYKQHPQDAYFFNTVAWWKMAPFMGAYGLFLIKRDPKGFFRYFVAPNLYRYALPPREILETRASFDWEEHYGGQYVRKIFHLNGIRFSNESIRSFQQILHPYPFIFLMIHIIFLVSVLIFILSGAWRAMSRFVVGSLFLVLTLWVIDFVFSVFSAGVVIRYEFFVVTMEFCFGFFGLYSVYSNIRQKEMASSIQVVG